MMMIPLVILIIILFVVFDRGPSRGSFGMINRHEKDALDILNERFARGEIQEEEYLKRKNILMNNR
jgi:putative membrane protein